MITITTIITITITAQDCRILKGITMMIVLLMKVCIESSRDISFVFSFFSDCYGIFRQQQQYLCYSIQASKNCQISEAHSHQTDWSYYILFREGSCTRQVSFTVVTTTFPNEDSIWFQHDISTIFFQLLCCCPYILMTTIVLLLIY